MSELNGSVGAVGPNLSNRGDANVKAGEKWERLVGVGSTVPCPDLCTLVGADMIRCWAMYTRNQTPTECKCARLRVSLAVSGPGI